jgi:two-component system sensor histidine kinase/response regulator
MSSSANRFMGFGERDVEDLSMIKEKAIRMHIMFLYVIVVFCLVYGIADLYLGQIQQAWVMLITIASAGISYGLYLRKKYFLSKIWNMSTLTVIILSVIIQTGIDSFAFIYYIPLMMGNLFIFYGREIIAGYIIIALNVLFMVGSFLCLDHFIELPKMSREMIETDGLMNLIGVSVICFAEVFFIVRVTNSISRKYIKKTRSLNARNQQLLSTLYTRDRMMAVMSHDLRSPVASLDSASELLLNGEIDRETEQTILRQFKGRTSGMLELIDKLLMWTRTQTNHIQYVESEIPLGELEEMVKTICLLSPMEKNIEFSVNFSCSNSEKVIGDRDMLETIFRNLITNASKYSKEGGLVQIAAHSTQMGCCFRVVDSGVGMSSEFLNKMNSGEVISTRGTKNEIGHGLGLQLVNDFLSKHSTQLNVSSVVGKGSEFYFYLKIAD